MQDLVDSAHLLDVPSTHLVLGDVAAASGCQDASILGRMHSSDLPNGVRPVARYYHGGRHAARMFRTYEATTPISFCSSAEDLKNYRVLVALFALFHDIVYGVAEYLGLCEQRSADFFVDYAAGREDLSKRDVWLVSQAILASANYAQHRPYLGPFVKLCLDLDLNELGTDWYWVNSVLVRREMSHVSEEDFIDGRKRFLHSMMARPQLFYSAHFQHYENNARINMSRELELLATNNAPWRDWSCVPIYVVDNIPNPTK